MASVLAYVIFLSYLCTQINCPPRTNLGLISEAYRRNIVSYTTLYILCIYPVILNFIPQPKHL